MPKSPSAGRSHRRPAKPPTSKRKGKSPWAPPQKFERAVGIAAARGAAGTPHALFVLHLERLDDVANRCGPEAENTLLDLVALVLRNLTGDQFPLCRLAIDQIAVIRERCVPSQVSVLARQMRTALEGGVFIWRGRHFRLAVHVGAAVLLPEPGGPGALVRRAGKACHAARESGVAGCIMLDGSERERARMKTDRAWIEHLGQTIA